MIFVAGRTYWVLPGRSLASAGGGPGARLLPWGMWEVRLVRLTARNVEAGLGDAGGERWRDGEVVDDTSEL